MKLKLKTGTTSKLARIFIQDSSATDGSGLTGLVYNSSGLTWYWIQEGDASATQVTMATMTVGTWASGGFKEVDATNMPGVYEIGIPNAAIDANGTTHMLLKGATNMAPVAIEIECDAIDYVDSVRAGLTALPNAAADAAGGLPISDAGGLDMDGLSSHSAADVWTAVTRTLTAATNVTSDGSAITMSASGIVGTVNVVNTTTTNTDMRGTDNALLAASAPTNFGDLAISVTTGQVTVGTNNDKTGYTISGTKTTLDALNDVSTADVNAQCDTAITDAALATAAALATVDSNVDAILVDTGTTLPASISALNDISVADILTTQMTESYAADGAAPTLTQAVMLIQQGLMERNVFQNTETVRKLDKTTVAATYTLNDAANPTDKTRAT